MTAWTDYLSKDRLAIFLFHGVTSGERRHTVRNYTRKHLPVREFRQIIHGLKRQGEAISMGDLLSSAGRETLPANAFAITFDDGFRNNYQFAAPVLADLDVPATFYVTTDFIENNTGSWIDRIEFAVEATPTVRLSIPWLSLQGSWSTPAEKIALLDRLRSTVKSSRDIDPERVAAAIWEQTGISEIEPDAELDQKLSWDEAATLASEPLFTVGGHSHTHPILEFLDDRRLEAEVKQSVSLLTRHLSQPVEHYSYPEGQPHCYSERVIACLKENGVRCCPTAEHGTNDAATDLFRLKRIAVI